MLLLTKKITNKKKNKNNFAAKIKFVKNAKTKSPIYKEESNKMN